MKKSIQVLWLCSWYPNEEDAYVGDFIQRQAQATALITPVTLFYIHKTTDPKLAGKESIRENGHLKEVIRYNYVPGQSGLSKLMGLARYLLGHIRFLKLYIQTYGKPDLIHVQVPIKAGVMALLFKWMYNIPYVVTEHYGIYNPYLNDHYKTRSVFFRWMTRMVVRNADKLLTVSHSLGEDMNRWVIQKAFEVVPNVVDTSLFHFKNTDRKSVFRFLHISNMIPLKNVGGMIEAVDLLRRERQDFELVFVGDIVEEYRTLAKNKKLNEKFIFFKGVMPYEAVAEQMQASQSLIIFSDTESQSCVVLEALCSGKPVIVTNVGGVKELVDEGNGLKTEPGDVAALAKKMNEMMNQYHEFNTQEISTKAQSKYGYREVGLQISAIYNAVLKSKD
ncbi:MAG: glycosyltransferase [Chitinophagaceae bacterium]|nr:glycosyltransferase [Chitinophagaceae bacterium]